ncbi:MAG: anion permease [Clostridia bacterium]|nr:anion permease [Clostridia bacterium]
MIYLLLAAGLFMGWSLGTNDAANAFGTAVATRVIKYRTAIIIIAVCVIIGSFVGGANNIGEVAKLATSNEVIASTDVVTDAIESGMVPMLKLKSALKAAIIFVCAGLTVFGMSYFKFPVSANQSITGAIIGWGLYYADYSNPEILSVNLPQIGKFAATWVLNPLGAGIISFILVKTVGQLLEKKLSTLGGYDTLIKTGYIIAGILGSYSIGVNSSANVTALYFDYAYSETGVAANLLTNPVITAGIGGIAIALGVLTYSKKVMMTVGGSIADITQMDGFLVIIAMALTVVLMGNLMGIPVSTSQAVVGAVVGAGLTRGVKQVNFGVFKSIGLAWIGSPTIAGVLAYAVAFLTQGFFG